MDPSFEKDVMPIFYNWRQHMTWRFDLTDYEVVKANKWIIWGRIKEDSDDPMPPAPYPPLTKEERKTFKKWMVKTNP